MTQPSDPIKHVVLLILENHAFDQMLGALQAVYPDLDGVAPGIARENRDPAGQAYAQAPTRERMMLVDPHHEVEHVAAQLADHNGGFVMDFATSFPESTPAARQFVMGYYPLDFLPALHALARNFTVCDRWFASVPGPTWPNRFFALTGTALGRVNMPDDGTHKADLPGYFQQTQDTLFDRLDACAATWKVYFHDIPQTTVLEHQRQPHNTARYFYIDEFFDDARGAEAEFPEFCLIEPDYLGFAQNDDHPPHDIMRAEKLIADVYNAIRGNEALWLSTLLIVYYDEHGGFYDHVEPPPAVPPDDHHKEYGFDRLGVRVPAILVSPWSAARVEHARFDHTSVLRYLGDKWGFAPLGRRCAGANSIASALAREPLRAQALPRITLRSEQLNPPDPEAEDAAFGLVTKHQAALQQLAAYLKAEALEQTPRFWSAAARCLEAVVAGAQRLLRFIYGEPLVRSSIAEPDRLASQKDAAARDNVARFIMRKKAYALIGLQRRLRDPSLPPPQREHALNTLALITGRKFHREPAAAKFAHADRWLRRELGN